MAIPFSRELELGWESPKPTVHYLLPRSTYELFKEYIPPSQQGEHAYYEPMMSDPDPWPKPYPRYGDSDEVIANTKGSEYNIQNFFNTELNIMIPAINDTFDNSDRIVGSASAREFQGIISGEHAGKVRNRDTMAEFEDDGYNGPELKKQRKF